MARKNFTPFKLKPLLVTIVYFLLSTVAHSQTLSLDSSFGNNGLLSIKTNRNFEGPLLKVLPAKGGNVFVIYASQYPVTFRNVVIVKYLRTGEVDTTFGDKGVTLPEYMSSFSDAVIQPDGKIIVTGILAYPEIDNIHDDIKIARFGTDGVLDKTFGNNGTIRYTLGQSSYDRPSGLTFQEDRIVISTFNYLIIGGFNVYQILVFNTNGISINKFQLGNTNTNSPNTNLNTRNIILSQGDKFIVEGKFAGKLGIYRYNANGTIDSTFGVNGILNPGFDYTPLAVQNDKLLVSGPNILARYNYDGTPDTSFNKTGKQTISVSKIAFQQGKIISVAGNNITRLNEDGSFDKSFGIDGVQSTGDLYNLFELLIDSNRLYIAGLIKSNTTSYGFVHTVAAYLLDMVTLSCTADKIIATDAGKCSAVVNDIDPLIKPVNFSLVTYQLSGATTGTGTGSVSGKTFNKGTTTVRYTITADPAKTCVFTITVEDHEAPMITNVQASPNSLWPADHKMKEVEIGYQLSDNCGASAVLSVTSNEPENGIDKDDLADDWLIPDAHHVSLRAERNGKGSGRVYTVTITATDQSGNNTVQNLTVMVPHDAPGNPHVKNKLKVKVYPNPTENYFTLLTETKSSELITIKIWNISGRLMEVKSKIAPNSLVQLGDGYHPGLYFAECSQGDQKVVVLLIKLRNK